MKPLAVKSNVFLPLLALLLAGCAAPQARHAAAPLPIAWSRQWTPLFNGRDLSNWAVTDFYAHGAVMVDSGQIKMAAGGILTGVNWTNGPLPTMNYTLSLEALKSDGNDFFCGLTFPVGASFCSLILGGWGGELVGLSSLDDLDASENETTLRKTFATGRWYQVRVSVSATNITAWLDNEKMVDAKTAGRKVSLRPGPIEFSKPLGVAAYQTGAAIRNVKLRLITP